MRSTSCYDADFPKMQIPEKHSIAKSQSHLIESSNISSFARFNRRIKFFFETIFFQRLFFKNIVYLILPDRRGVNTKIHLDAHGVLERFFCIDATIANCTIAEQLRSGLQAKHWLADCGYNTNAIIHNAR